ncbi:hypothetical protein G6F43_000678 [Rhizopus delemar]|nr:hypothetical protein G6F43_000678 [Rhizopus delemar]
MLSNTVLSDSFEPYIQQDLQSESIASCNKSVADYFSFNGYTKQPNIVSSQFLETNDTVFHQYIDFLATPNQIDEGNKNDEKDLEVRDFVTLSSCGTKNAQTMEMSWDNCFTSLSSPALHINSPEIDKRYIDLSTQQLILPGAEQFSQRFIQTTNKSQRCPELKAVSFQEMAYPSPPQLFTSKIEVDSKGLGNTPIDFNNNMQLYPKGFQQETVQPIKTELLMKNGSTVLPFNEISDPQIKRNHQSSISVSVPLTPSQPIINKKRKLLAAKTDMIFSPKHTSSSCSSAPLASHLLPSQAGIISQPIVDRRRSAHKVAEQRRRDALKQNFDALREEIVDVLLAQAVQKGKLETKNRDLIRREKEKEVKAMSKILIVEQSYKRIVQLKAEAYAKDEKIKRMQIELDSLKQKISTL